jgi:hypothetical protein
MFKSDPVAVVLRMFLLGVHVDAAWWRNEAFRMLLLKLAKIRHDAVIGRATVESGPGSEIPSQGVSI